MRVNRVYSFLIRETWCLPLPSLEQQKGQFTHSIFLPLHHCSADCETHSFFDSGSLVQIRPRFIWKLVTIGWLPLIDGQSSDYCFNFGSQTVLGLASTWVGEHLGIQGTACSPVTLVHVQVAKHLKIHFKVFTQIKTPGDHSRKIINPWLEHLLEVPEEIEDWITFCVHPKYACGIIDCCVTWDSSLHLCLSFSIFNMGVTIRASCRTSVPFCDNFQVFDRFSPLNGMKRKPWIFSWKWNCVEFSVFEIQNLRLSFQ